MTNIVVMQINGVNPESEDLVAALIACLNGNEDTFALNTNRDHLTAR